MQTLLGTCLANEEIPEWFTSSSGFICYIFSIQPRIYLAFTKVAIYFP